MLIKESTFEINKESLIGSKTNHCDGTCDFLKKEASVDSIKYFNDLIPKPDHVYLLVVAMTAGEYYGCFTKHNIFMSADGDFKPASEIEKRDLVVSHDNSINMVNKAISKKWTGRFSKLNARGIPEIKCTDNHEFYVVKKTEIKGKDHNCIATQSPYAFTWEEARNIKKGDFLVIPRPRKRMTQQEQSIMQPLHSDYARIFGYFWAVGVYAKNEKGVKIGISFSFNIDENRYIEEISNISDRLGYGYTITKDTGNQSISIMLDSKCLADFVFEHCGESINMQMSKRLFVQRDSFMLAMIGAYINGNGHSSAIDGRTTFLTCSKTLLLQLKQILFSMGIPTSYQWGNNINPEGKATFHIGYASALREYSDKIANNPFSLKTKTDNTKN